MRIRLFEEEADASDAARAHRLLGILKWLAFGLVIALPWLLLHARAAAEIGVDLVSACFMLRCVGEWQWSWLRRTWVKMAVAWWVWLVGCTAVNIDLPGQDANALLQAIAIARFLVFTAALETWVLQGQRERRWLYLSLCLATFYVALQTLLQYATGRNLYGAPRWGDGSLTGPFRGPRRDRRSCGCCFRHCCR